MLHEQRPLAWLYPTSEGIRSMRRVGQGDDFMTTIKQTLGDVLPRVPESTRHSMQPNTIIAIPAGCLWLSPLKAGMPQPMVTGARYT